MVMNIQGSMTTVLPIEDASQVGHARRVAQSLAVECAFDETDAGRVALVATELATNLLRHAQHGAMHLRRIPAQSGPGIELIAIDRGTGFNHNQCLAEGFSTGGPQGTGPGALMRQAPPFDNPSNNQG